MESYDTITRDEKVNIILEGIRDHLDVPSYLEDYVKKDIITALRQIEAIENK